MAAHTGKLCPSHISADRKCFLHFKAKFSVASRDSEISGALQDVSENNHGREFLYSFNTNGLILEFLSQGICFSGDLEYLVLPRSVALVHSTVLQSNFQFFKFHTCAFICIHLLAGSGMGQCYMANSPLDDSAWPCRDNSMCVSNRR